MTTIANFCIPASLLFSPLPALNPFLLCFYSEKGRAPKDVNQT